MHPLPGTDPAKEVALSASSVEFVGVPLDVAMAYYFRAKKCVTALPPSRRLHWLQAKDVEERSEWVTRFREGTSPLGVIIKQVMEARDAHWVVTSAAVTSGAGEQQATGGTGQAALPPPPPQISHFREGPKVDGTKLCPDFQVGKCSSKSCAKGAHKCGVIVRSQRACGSPGHGAPPVPREDQIGVPRGRGGGPRLGE